MRVRACGKKILETDWVVDELVLCIDDEEILDGVVSPDKRMKCARLLNQHCQPSWVEKRWRRSAVRTRAGAGRRGEIHHGSGTVKSAKEMERHGTLG